MWHPLWPDLPEEESRLPLLPMGPCSNMDRAEDRTPFNKYLGPTWLEDHDNPNIWGLIDDILIRNCAGPLLAEDETDKYHP